MLRTLALSMILSAPLAAVADDHNFVFSPVGPGEGNGALALGARMYSVPDVSVPIPMVEVAYARGLTEALHLEANLATLGVLSLGDLGMRLRVLGSADTSASLALEVGVSAIGAVHEDGGAFIGAATPGLSLGIGSRGFQLTLGLDAPIALVGGSKIEGQGTVFDTGAALFLRPSIAIEGAVSEEWNLFLRGSVYMVPEAGFEAHVPSISIGASF